MGVHARIRCFCSSAVSVEDPQETRSSEWCALPCGHIWHTKCVERWAKDQQQQKKTSGYPCPNRCPEERVSKKDPMTGQRRLVPFVKLYFDDDVQSDGFDSSQVVDVGSDEVSSGGLRMGIGAYGKRFLPRPPKELRKGKERALGGRDGAGGLADAEEDIAEEEEEDEDDGSASRSEQELTRLRRELREAISAARQVAGLREQVERLKETNTRLELDVTERNERITTLEEEAKELDAEIEQLEEGQPDLKGKLSKAQEEVEVLGATNAELEDVVNGLEETIEAKVKERDEARNDLHEAKIKAGETIRRLEDRVRSAGTAGEERIKALEREAEALNRTILDLRCEKDRLELTNKEDIKRCRATAAEKIKKADKAVEEATQAKKLAEDNAKAETGRADRIASGNASWKDKYNKLKSKYTKLKSRRAHTAISDDDDGDDDFAPVFPPPHSPVMSLQRLPSHRSALDSSPESALPFKMNINSTNLSHASGSATQSTAIFSPDDVDPNVAGRRKRSAAEVIDLCSDEDEDALAVAAEEEDEEQDDLFADPFASGSGTWSGFGAGGRLASHSPQPKRQKQRGASSVPMPTLSGSTGVGGGPWGPKKVELSKQRSDRHLPDFGAGASTKELGPKAKIKMGVRRG
ncbi:hypothetical protein BCR35DRAFT_298030 [Leucosporidium creatinivorum]|uniref:RING-type domain-containing protein n=1 Tax=Leucosporidium creatinivorum TaxID=106004 RepID=A0A1Y2G3Q7_9BASI|nr:hypothetical protein BCR35DRAFT_298030 [Leucosporidium creatinivorum]